MVTSVKGKITDIKGHVMDAHQQFCWTQLRTGKTQLLSSSQKMAKPFTTALKNPTRNLSLIYFPDLGAKDSGHQVKRPPALEHERLNLAGVLRVNNIITRGTG